MKIFLNHGIKLTFANFLGSILSALLTVLGFFIFGLIALVLTVGTSLFELVEMNFNIFKFFSSFPLPENPFWLISLGVLALFLILYQFTVQSMIISGLYGSAIRSTYEQKGSMGAYFLYFFRHLGRITRLQILLLILSIPLLLVIGIIVIFLQMLFETDMVIFFQASFTVLLIVLFITLFLHAPIFIIKNDVGAFRSILLSFDLLKRGVYPVLTSGAIFFSVLGIINAVFILLFALIFSNSGFSLTNFQFEDFNFLSMMIGVLVFLVWGSTIFPYSMICALLMLIKRFRDQLEPYMESLTEQSSKPDATSES